MSGWPDECPDEILTPYHNRSKPYHNRRNELSCEQDLCPLGHQGHYSTIIGAKMLGAATLGTPWCMWYESHRLYVHVVARNGPGN